MTSQTITLHPGDSVTIVAAQSSGGGTQPPDTGPPTEPPPITTPPGVTLVEYDWNNPPHDSSGAERLVVAMGVNTIIACHFKTPAGQSTFTGAMEAAEFGSPPSARIGVISKAPGDFAKPVTTGMAQAMSKSTSPSVVFGVGHAPQFTVALEPATDYYFNIKNDQPCTCAEQGVCDMFIHLRKPGGL